MPRIGLPPRRTVWAVLTEPRRRVRSIWAGLQSRRGSSICTPYARKMSAISSLGRDTSAPGHSRLRFTVIPKKNRSATMRVLKVDGVIPLSVISS
jgi:hypothetical protein